MEPQSPASGSIPEPDEDGNYSSPALVALNNAWNDFLDEKVEEGQLMAVIAEVGHFCEFQLAQLQGQIKQGVVDPEQESFQMIYESFEAMIDACNLMALEIVDPDPEDEIEEPEEGFFVSGLELVQEATNQMVTAMKMTMEHIDATAEVSCMFCQTTNPRGSQKCSNCGRVIQAPGEKGPSSFSAVNQEGLDQKSGMEGQTTQNCIYLKEAIAAWRAEQIDTDRLYQAMEEVENRLASHLDDLPNQEQEIGQAPPAKQRALLDALALTQQALEQSLAAIDRMRLAFEKEDDTYLELGMTDFEAASKVMLESYLASKAAIQ